VLRHGCLLARLTIQHSRAALERWGGLANLEWCSFRIGDKNEAAGAAVAAALADE